MTELGKRYPRTTTTGDRAVSGLLAGIGAGVAMLAYLLVAGLLVGDSVTTTLLRFNGNQTAFNPLASALAHLAVSGIYGIVFGVLVHSLYQSRRVHAWPLWALGVLFGMTLLLIAQTVVLPAADSPLLQIPLVHWALAHVIYGAALGNGMGWMS